jgi:hypothetical protein
MKQPTELHVLIDHELHFICAQDHTSAIAVADLLTLADAPADTLQAMRRAICKRCGQPAADFRIVFAGNPNNRPPR